MMDYKHRFNRAKSRKTLEIMIEGLARKKRLSLNIGVNSYRQHALSYKRLRNMDAYHLFMAAHARDEALAMEESLKCC
jgi:hypothetical protein